ncbi:hypothetical protein GCM10023259_082580 [Thermocatellispora tengchongensis]
MEAEQQPDRHREPLERAADQMRGAGRTRPAEQQRHPPSIIAADHLQAVRRPLGRADVRADQRDRVAFLVIQMAPQRAVQAAQRSTRAAAGRDRSPAWPTRT